MATKSNIKTIKDRGIRVVGLAEGRLACGDIGRGRLSDVDDILECIYEVWSVNMNLKDKNVLVTAGVT